MVKVKLGPWFGFGLWVWCAVLGLEVGLHVDALVFSKGDNDISSQRHHVAVLRRDETLN